MSSCAACGAPLQQAARGRQRRYCSDACRKAASRERGRSWAWMEENEPPAASLPTLEDVYAAAHGGAPPSPDDSTLDDVAQTVIEAQAVAGAFRRHGVAAAPALALRCEGVASALDAAIAEHFGDVLKD